MKKQENVESCLVRVFIICILLTKHYLLSSTTFRWVGHVEQMGEMRRVYILVGETKVKKNFGYVDVDRIILNLCLLLLSYYGFEECFPCLVFDLLSQNSGVKC
jgi:hypothetical protein